MYFVLVIPISRSSPNACTNELENMMKWSVSIGLRINSGKCKALWISKSHQAVVPVILDFELINQLRILGVVFTPDLKWNRQAPKILSKRLFALKILQSIFYHTSLVYNGLVLSIIEYCSPCLSACPSKTRHNTHDYKKEHIVSFADPTVAVCLEDLTERQERAAMTLLCKISQTPLILCIPFAPVVSFGPTTFCNPLLIQCGDAIRFSRLQYWLLKTCSLTSSFTFTSLIYCVMFFSIDVNPRANIFCILWFPSSKYTCIFISLFSPPLRNYWGGGNHPRSPP